MKTRPDTLRTAENGSRRTRFRLKRVSTPSVPPKTCPGAQNMKTGHDAVGTAENESGHAKHENGTWRPPYRRKRVRERKNMKTGADALGSV
jgi:hypothetical protein